VRQPGAPTVHLLHRPVWQRPCTRVLGLDGRAKPLSGGDGSRGATPRKVEEWERFGAGGAYEVEEQEGELDPEMAEPLTPTEPKESAHELRWSDVVSG
jgi:hypothetical protein